MQLVKEFTFDGKGSITSPLKLGKFLLNHEETDTSPLFVMAEVQVDGDLTDRTFYFFNFESAKSSLFQLPRTKLDWQVEVDSVRITNQGNLPAVAVYVEQSGHLDTFTVSDNYFWLEPGEVKTVEVSSTDGIKVLAWNAS